MDVQTYEEWTLILKETEREELRKLSKDPKSPKLAKQSSLIRK
jgi:hypothetical protein